MDVPISFLNKLCKESDFDLNSVCRLCFSAETEWIPIRSELETCESDGPKSVLELIQACVQLEATDNEIRPENVCHNCFSFLTKWYEFKYKCHETDLRFKDWNTSKAPKNPVNQQVVESLAGKADVVNFDVNEVLKTATIVENEDSGNADGNEDFWVLLVEDGPDGKSVQTLKRSSAQSLGLNGQIIASSNQIKKTPKMVTATPTPSKVKQVRFQAESSLAYPNIMQAISNKKYKVDNGCIRINRSDFFSQSSAKNSKGTATEIKTAGDLFSKTVFSLPEVIQADGSSLPIIVDTTCLSNQISGNTKADSANGEESGTQSNNFLTKIQKLIDDNDTILKTSALNVKNAHSVLKTAENALQGTPSFRNFNHRKKFVAKDKESLVRKVMSKSVVASRLKKKVFMACDICGEKFINYEKLLIHDRSDHNDSPRPHSCFLCNTSYLTEDHLSLHILVKHGDVSYSLDSSDDENLKNEAVQKRSRNRSTNKNASRKRKKADSSAQPETLKCYICNETFSLKSSLDKHLETCEKLIFLL